MITFLVCLALLVTAYFVYGRYLEKLADVDTERKTPVERLEDGVDYIRLPRWRVFLIQLLNIAGTGPIFGAILGACFGPVAFLWITLDSHCDKCDTEYRIDFTNYLIHR